MTQSGETENYDVYSHIKAIEDHVGEKVFEYVLVNDNIKIPSEVLERYKLEFAEPVKLGDHTVCRNEYVVIRDNLMENIDNRIRHSMDRLANAINKVYNKYK